MRKKLFHIKTCLYAVMLALSGMMSGCFTGIESTKQIEMTRQDRRLTTPSPEEVLMEAIKPLPLSEWTPGYAFDISDKKADLILNHEPGATALNKGDRLYFQGVDAVSMPDGKDYARIVFRSNKGADYFYNTGKSLADAQEGISSEKLPMMVDVRMISLTDSILRGVTAWNRSPIAYASDGERVNMLKYSNLSVDSISLGEGYFPLKLWTKLPTDISGNRSGNASALDSVPVFFYLDFNSSLAESRPFRKLFSLSDPKLNYPQITDEVWRLIRGGKIAPGMTKDECRLSLGNPSDVNSGHDYNSTIDLWQYPDGTFLRFIDGLLVSYRK